MEATGVLLIGGLSRRFGSVKALAQLGDETLAERGWRVLGDGFAERIAVGKEADQLGLSFPVLDDGTSVRAPLAGVVAGLRAAPTEVAVFLPVDSPLVSAGTLRALAEACERAAITQSGPLPGAFAKSALPVLERRLEAGELELNDAAVELEAQIVQVDPEELANVDTERELERVRGVVNA